MAELSTCVRNLLINGWTPSLPMLSTTAVYCLCAGHRNRNSTSFRAELLSLLISQGGWTRSSPTTLVSPVAKIKVVSIQVCITPGCIKIYKQWEFKSNETLKNELLTRASSFKYWFATPWLKGLHSSFLKTFWEEAYDTYLVTRSENGLSSTPPSLQIKLLIPQAVEDGVTQGPWQSCQLWGTPVGWRLLSPHKAS